MKAWCVLFGLVPNLLALEITTLDGKTYRDCQVSKVFPDSICVVYGGSGARIKFKNLPEPVRAQYGYDPERATAFEQSEAARLEREQALLAAQRLQSAQRRAAAAVGPNQTPRSQFPGYGNSGSEYAGVRVAGAVPGYGGNQTYNQGNQFGNQSGNGFAGAQYVGVRMAGPGGIRGVTSPTPTQARPPGNVFP